MRAAKARIRGSKPITSGVPVDVVASMCNLTPRRVQQLVAEGVLPRQHRGKYNLSACVSAYITYLQQNIDAAHMEAQVDDAAVTLERTLKLRIHRRRMELKLSRESSSIISADLARAELQRYHKMVRRVLLTVPSRYADTLPAPLLEELISNIVRDAGLDAEDLYSELQPWGAHRDAVHGDAVVDSGFVA